MFTFQVSKSKGISKFMWKAIQSSAEMYRFFAGLLRMGIDRKPKMTDYWSQGLKSPFFTDDLGISGNRFVALNKCVKLSSEEDDKKNICEKEGYDRILKIRLLVDHFKDRCRSLFHPSKHICIDGRRLRFKGRHTMKQYVPCKPTPYGFRLWALADSETGYLVDFSVYYGSTGDKPEHGLTTDVVLQLVDPGPGLKLGAGYQLCVDNYYTSRVLLEKPLEKKILACGTLRRNRKGFPKQLTNSVAKSYRGDFQWVGDGRLTYYEWNDNSQAVFVSSMHPGADGSMCTQSVEKTKQLVSCPPVVPYYNKYMGRG